MRIGVVGYLAKTGIGIMVDDFAVKLGAVAQLVIPHDKADKLIPSNDRTLIYSKTWIPPVKVVNEFADLVDVVISVESDWGCNVYPLLRERGVKVVLLPMFEWWNPGLPMNKHIDLFICTTMQCYEGVPFENKVFIPCPIDTHRIEFKKRSGKPRHFVHNAGNLGIGGRKGTLEVVRAFRNTRNPDITLRVNSQVLLTKDIIGHIAADIRISMFVKNHEDYAELYKEGDVLIYTPHYDGQALVSAEAMAAGMPVITLDAAPMDEHWKIYKIHDAWKANMFVRVGATDKAQTLNPRSLKHFVDEEHLTNMIDGWAGIEIDSISEMNRNIALRCFSWDVCLPFYRHYLEVICNTSTP